MNKAAFLDRDGVINRKAKKGEYITLWEEVQILPGVAAAIALLNQADFRVIVVTNQRCVAKGLLTTASLERMHVKMSDTLAAAGARIDGFYYCPHEMNPPCSCRKPAPGMLLAAAQAHQVDLGASWMIGDSENDIVAGRRAGCKTAHISGAPEDSIEYADLTAQSLLDATQQILMLESQASSLAPSLFKEIRLV
jgi:D-glycero-D-manno-heptose 1,7-bisphosphate phosphatase